MKITAKNLYKNYDGINALNGISFELSEGDFVNVMGESGCGKTTLLKCIAGIEKLTSGELYFNDELANNIVVQQRHVAYVSQEFSLFPNLTVFENVFCALKKQKGSYDEKCSAVWNILQKTGLEEISNAFPKELSYGQRQKTAIARAIVKQPQIILFDEPLSNIDPASKVVYKQLIAQTKKIFPQSVFFYVTHNSLDAVALGNKTMILEKGKIVQFGNTNNVLEYPSTINIASICWNNIETQSVIVNDSEVLTEQGKIELSPFLQATFSAEKGKELSLVTSGNRALIYADGNLVCGRQSSLKIPCNISQNSVSVDEKKPLGELSAGVVSCGEGYAICGVENIFTSPQNANDISFVSKIIYCDDARIVCECFNQKITINAVNVDSKAQVGQKLQLFIPIACLTFFDKNGDIAISDYRIYPNVAKAKVLNAQKGIVRIGKLKLTLPFALKKVRQIDLLFEKDAFSVSLDKKQLKAYKILNTQVATHAIVFVLLEGFDRYVTMILPSAPQNDKKIFFSVDISKIKVL